LRQNILRQQTWHTFIYAIFAPQLQLPDFFFMRHAGSMRDAERRHMRFSPAVRRLRFPPLRCCFRRLRCCISSADADALAFRRRAARFRCHALPPMFTRHAFAMPPPLIFLHATAMMLFTLFTYATPPLHFSFSPLFCCHAYAFSTLLLPLLPFSFSCRFRCPAADFLHADIFRCLLTLLPLLRRHFEAADYVIAARAAAAADFRFHADAAADFRHAAAMLPAPCRYFRLRRLCRLFSRRYRAAAADVRRDCAATRRILRLSMPRRCFSLPLRRRRRLLDFIIFAATLRQMIDIFETRHYAIIAFFHAAIAAASPPLRR
jgi:hypothetical protein